MRSREGYRRGIRRSLAAVALAVTAALLAGCSGSGQAAHVDAFASKDDGQRMPSATAQQLQALLDGAVKLSGGSGGVAGVWAPWAGTWTAAAGTVSKAKGAASVSQNPSFRIGSLTKPLTCTVLLDLVAAHKVKLNDRVSKYLPQMVGVGDVTLEQLCANTSGIADYWNTLLPQMVTNPSRDWAPLELVSTALGEAAPTPPGTAWKYSNAGFVLLGEALQAATGESLQKLYERYVTGPLGISATTVLPTGTALPSPSLTGYAPNRDVVTGATDCSALVDVTALSPSALQAAGGLVSTLTDTASLAHAVAAGDLLAKGYATQQQHVGPMSASLPSWAGYGLGVEKMGPFVGHASSVPGFVTAAYSDPASGLTVVIMVNDSAPSANFARIVALELATVASKAPAARGKSAPSVGLPWTLGELQAALPYETGCHAHPGKPVGAVAAITRLAPGY